MAPDSCEDNISLPRDDTRSAATSTGFGQLEADGDADEASREPLLFAGDGSDAPLRESDAMKTPLYSEELDVVEPRDPQELLSGLFTRRVLMQLIFPATDASLTSQLPLDIDATTHETLSTALANNVSLVTLSFA